MSGKILNLHNAKLPDYRGHNSISFEILNREVEHTTTLHWVDIEVDRGKLVKSKSIKIEENDTAYSLWCRSLVSGIEILIDWFEDLKNLISCLVV